MIFHSNIPDYYEKKLLKSLVYTSDLSGLEQQQVLQAIDNLQTYKKYQYIEDQLSVRQLSIDQIQNPSQKDINLHLKKSVQ